MIWMIDHTFIAFIFIFHFSILVNMSHFKTVHIILYVQHQVESTSFYQQILQQEPVLNVPGMTEFDLSENLKLGLMPNAGIAKILQEKTPHPDEAQGIPRCELYLKGDDVQQAYEQAIKAGAKLISPIEDRNWGDKVCYFSDPDGHIIAFAQ